MLGEDALGLLGHFAICARQDAIEVFHHGHFRTEAAPDGAEFEADDARADHDHALGHGLEGEAAGGGDDAILVDVDAHKRGGFRAGGDHDVLGFENLVAGGAGDDDAARAVDAAGSVEHGHLVLLHDVGDASGETRNRVGLLFQHVVEVELEACHLDAEAGEILARRLVEFGGVKHCLGRDAAHVEAGSAQLVALLDEGDLQAQLSAARGAVVTAGAAADDDDVKSLAHGSVSSLFACGGSYTRIAGAVNKGVRRRNMGIGKARIHG